jgi:hypothetical integral membrane protein (TIGR02206 family)
VELLSVEHAGALAAIGALAALAVWAPRARPGGWVVAASRALAALIVLALLADHAVAAARGLWSARTYLPLHLSDAATIAAALALWLGRPALVELTYFWGLTASLQATVTPDLGHTFPDPLFLTFFVTHGGVVVAALLLVAGRRIVPRAGAVRRAFLATLAVAAAAALGSLLTGGNYMFLRRKPDDSLLDLLGPWPWYIASAGVLALALFALLDAPWRHARRT